VDNETSSGLRFLLPFKAALLQCLDGNQKPVRNGSASGFIRRENDDIFLYTCWHVVSGYDPNDIRIGMAPPDRRYLRVAFQGYEKRQPGVEVVGGSQTLILPLYKPIEDEIGKRRQPLWFQDDAYIPHPDLNGIGLHVPFWHDIVKIRLPSNLQISELQLIDENLLLRSGVVVGDKCFVVGYPYGFSAKGSAQPTPLVLTRFVATNIAAFRRRDLLLERIGAPTMSGGPVFVERDGVPLLLGAYTGSIYPDYKPDDDNKSSNELTTALGTVVDLTSVFAGQLPLVEKPSRDTQRPLEPLK
jgi:hypothetical protein